MPGSIDPGDPDRPAVGRIPRATYRVQLNAGFTFKDLTAAVPYLAALGISHVYCSPYLRARSGSAHGYDVIDHNSFNPEIGSRADFDRLVAELRAHGMGHILDIVPNHVGVMGSDNVWWMDVLENGQASIYADYFDIDWNPANTALADKVLVPVLADPYGVVLERGDLRLRFEHELGSFAIHYHEHRMPLDPRTYPRIIDAALEIERNPELEKLRRLFGALPDRRGATPEQIAERNRDKEAHKRALAELVAADAGVYAALHQALASLAGNPDDPASFDPLHELLESQAFRLAFWRVAADDINYRRFFDVNDLAALRVENDAVFEATHRLVLELIGAGALDGLRIDHADGLYDPLGYFRRLTERIAQATAAAGASRPVYLVVEKITASFERLPADWPLHGETGYHFANVVNRLLVDAGSKGRMSRIYRSFIGEPRQWSDVTYECQHRVLRKSLASELNTAANLLARIAQSDRRTRDFTLASLWRTLAEVIACFPVYRTYVTDVVTESDRRYIDWAIAVAGRRASSVEQPVLDFVRNALLLELAAPSERARARMRRFAMKFQQITAPITAKGIEDTALYRFNRLVSLNEVGGEPDLYGSRIAAFHTDAQYRAKHWPHEMLTTSTHDTKRSEDVRARINVLSEMPTAWRQAVDRWRRFNRTRRREVDGLPAPSPDDEYLLYQTLIGTWPLQQPEEAALDEYRQRIEAYMLKAAREAKSRTSWAAADPQYEEALTQFIRAALERREPNLFLADFCAFNGRIVRFGLLNGLSQTLLKLTAPGVPDIYQGNETWRFSLVDPDNRGPVDYAAHRRLLEALTNDPAQDSLARRLAEDIADPRCKLFLHIRSLQLRRQDPELFERGEYLPLKVTGRRAAHICAFARILDGRLAVVMAPRLYLRLMGAGSATADDRLRPPLGAEVWEDTAVQLPSRLDAPLRGVLDGAEVPQTGGDGPPAISAAAALRSFPVALLTSGSRQRHQVNL
ncbi:MAG: malto-oligosyltrehalose synthase [Gammaproteobacteria bacterium]|nr:malto-oligosyltrehalose synthase [Gammaproteobacteria bacterium]